MKTRKQIQKTGSGKMNSALLIIVLGLSVFNSLAGNQKTIRQVNGPIQISVVSVEKKDFRNNQESTLALGTVSSTSSSIDMKSKGLNFNESTEQEKSLKIEDWMICEKNFTPTLSVPTEKEAPLKLESWMTEARIWNN